MSHFLKASTGCALTASTVSMLVKSIVMKTFQNGFKFEINKFISDYTNEKSNPFKNSNKIENGKNGGNGTSKMSAIQYEDKIDFYKYSFCEMSHWFGLRCFEIE